MKSFCSAVGIVAFALALCWSVAFAGINPANPGLPSSNTNLVTANEGYLTTLDNAANNAGSAMCVDCHGRNPSRHTVYGTTTAAATRWGTHWVTSTMADTSSHGGYSGGGGAATVGKYLHGGPWAATGTAEISTGTSKYALKVSNGFSSTAPAAAATDNTHQVICESCHNLMKNVGYRKLLAIAGANFDNVQGSYLCVGCHGDMQNDFNNEPSYFGGTVQDHHVNAVTPTIVGTTVPYRGTVSATTSDRNMTMLDNAYYVSKRMWAFSRGEANVGTTARAYAWGTANGSPGTKAAGGFTITNSTKPDGITIGTNNIVQCNSCHRPHNAVSSTGALIFQNGIADTYTFGQLTDAPANGNAPMVLQRTQGDPKSFTGNLLKESQGLCNGCHAAR